MSDSALKRIEQAVARLGERQEEICERLQRLEQTVGALPRSSAGASREEVIAFLDQFRAGEALGEASLGAWIAVSPTQCLRGALRTIQMREGSHARLLAERIKELGGSASFEIPEAVHESVMQDAASTAKSDAEKVEQFVAQFPDIDVALAPIHALADRLEGDPETQFLLRTIAQDERATLEFVHEARALLKPS
jgi:DNA repair exonuclease SbcCD ATPase subunit